MKEGEALCHTNLQAGDKVRLLRDFTSEWKEGYPTLFKGSEHTVQFVRPDGQVIYIEGQHRALPFYPHELERIEADIKPGFNCKAGTHSWANLGMPYLQNETSLSPCQVEAAEVATLAKLRAKRERVTHD